MRVIDSGRRVPVEGLAFFPDGMSLAYGMLNVGWGILDLTGSRTPSVFHHGVSIDPSHLVFGPGPVVYSISDQGRVGFAAATGAPVSVGPHDPSVPGYCRAFAQSVDGSRLVTAHADGLDGINGIDGTVWLAGWVAAGGWERTWLVSQGPSSGLALAPGGDRIAQTGCLTAGGFAYDLLIRDAATGALVARGRYPYSMLARPRYRPDGRQIVAVRGMVLVVWDPLMPGKPQLVKNDTRSKFTAAAYHPSGRYLFTTSYDATVSVWDTEDWVRVRRFDWDIGRLRSVAVSPDGLLAAAGSDRGRVVVWDVDV